MELRERIAALLEKKALIQADLLRLLKGIGLNRGRPWISECLSGKAAFAAEHTGHLARALNLSVLELMDGVEEPWLTTLRMKKATGDLTRDAFLQVAGHGERATLIVPSKWLEMAHCIADSLGNVDVLWVPDATGDWWQAIPIGMEQKAEEQGTAVM